MDPGYVRTFLQVPELAHLVEGDTEDELRLTNRVNIVTLPCNARAVRGLSCAVVILDEFAWMQGVDGSAIAADEVWSAVVPSTAAFPESRVLVLSTPRWPSGPFFDLCEQADHTPGMRAFYASTAIMNPGIPGSFLDAEQAKDPDARGSRPRPDSTTTTRRRCSR